MALNTVTLTGNIGPNATHPSAITVQVQFIENAVNAAAGTSAVKVIVKLINNNDSHERFYTKLNGHLNLTVGGMTRRLGHSRVLFDIRGGHTKTLATIQFNSLNNRAGSIPVSIDGSWPSYYAGHNAVSTSGTLTLTSGATPVSPAGPPPPTAPVWPSNGNAVGPAGVGTSTYLNWISKANISPSGAAQYSPYDSMSLLVSQSSYPDFFTPVTLSSDLGSVHPAGGRPVPGFANYAVETFWYTTLGKSRSSLVVYATNIGAGDLLTVEAPKNPPAFALGWGVAVAKTTVSGASADPTKVTVQTATPLTLGKSWTEPVGGVTTNGGAPPPSSFADTMTWSRNVAITVNPANTSLIYPTIGGYWYQFHLVVGNSAGWVSQAPLIYFAPGIAPSLGANGSDQAGETNVNVIYAPMANIAVIGQSFNRLNASASVQPIVAQVIDFAAQSNSLTERATPLTLINYCADPRAYWLTASTGGNTTASPYVAEQAAAGYTSHNAQALPTAMTYALQALGLGEIDRGHTMTFVAANNNTGSQVSHYVYVGGNPDSANLAAALQVPSGANTVAVSALAWINSANAAPGRTVTPFAGLRFTALYANGVVAGSNTVPLNAIGVNALEQLGASWTLPANANAVVAALIANTAAGAAWNGGYQAGDSITTSGFMVLFDAQPNTPYFDGGYPYQPTYAIHTSADLALTRLSDIPNTRDGHAAGVP